MSKTGNVFFTEFLDDFYAETEEHIAIARRQLMLLESASRSGSVDKKAVEELLRNFHSIKGLSAMVGFDEIAQVAHRLEDYLRKLKEPGAFAPEDDLAQLFQSVEAVEKTLAAHRDNETTPDLSPLLIALENLGSAAVPLTSRESPPAAPAPLQSWKFEFHPTLELAAKGVNVTHVRANLENIGRIVQVSPRIREKGSVIFEFTVATDRSESAFRDLLADGVSYSPAEPRPAPEDAEQIAAASPVQEGQSAANLVRVDMRRLDDLMRLVGELVISRAHLDETLDSAQKAIPPVQWRSLEEINSSMGRQLRDLRESVMRIRMVPVGQVFERMRFVMRGLERDTQKRVRLEVRGQETEIDKLIVERIMDPLLHLVRNAISHGIEAPAERQAAGKPAEGLLRLSASSEGETVRIDVEDDGHGIDFAKVEKRARAAGLLRKGEAMDPGKVLDLISAPGFSTRDSADLASGRGVGMAVVRNAVQDLGGTLAMHTEGGHGTRFSMRLPLTLAIADALLVEAAGQRYALPQAMVREVLPVEKSAVVKLENNEVISYRDGVLPLIRLRRLFGLTGRSGKRLHVLVLSATAGNIGLAVDRIVGQREIVIRSIADPMLKVPGITGATELGDGRPILILDAQALIRLHANQGQRK
jgi:two-component system chemotaxis sensor kinase CheA